MIAKMGMIATWEEIVLTTARFRKGKTNHMPPPRWIKRIAKAADSCRGSADDKLGVVIKAFLRYEGVHK